MALQLGDTFYWGGGGHLWIVISDPTANGGVFVAVNITKDWFRAGSECVLNPGEHEWISCKCYVNFGDALKLGPVEHGNLVASISTGEVKTDLPASSNLLQKIVAAGKRSKALADELIALL